MLINSVSILFNSLVDIVSSLTSSILFNDKSVNDCISALYIHTLNTILSSTDCSSFTDITINLIVNTFSEFTEVSE
jgi:hypothetical protein